MNNMKLYYWTLNYIFAEFFKKKGVSTLTMKELFDFVTDMTINSDNIDAYLEQAMAMTSHRTVEDVTEQQKVDEEVQTSNKKSFFECVFHKLHIYIYIYIYIYNNSSSKELLCRFTWSMVVSVMPHSTSTFLKIKVHHIMTLTFKVKLASCCLMK